MARTSPAVALEGGQLDPAGVPLTATHRGPLEALGHSRDLLSQDLLSNSSFIVSIVIRSPAVDLVSEQLDAAGVIHAGTHRAPLEPLTQRRNPLRSGDEGSTFRIIMAGLFVVPNNAVATEPGGSEHNGVNRQLTERRTLRRRRTLAP